MNGNPYKLEIFQPSQFNYRTLLWLAETFYYKLVWQCSRKPKNKWSWLYLTVKTSTALHLYRGWCPKFVPGLFIKIGICSSKSIWVIILSFCQNDSPMRVFFWQKDSFDHSYTFWTISILIFSPGTNFGHHPLILNTKRCLKLKWCGYSSMFTSYAKQEMFCATIYQGCRHLPWGPGYCQKFEIFSGPLSSSLFAQLRHLSGYNLD